MGRYTRTPRTIGQDISVLQCGRATDKLVKVKPDLPGNVILIHGVNDVGVSYDQVEQGLCAGLGDRLGWQGQYRHADYRMPKSEDQGTLEIDPDAVFFKRQLKEGHHTPVIPFYWGYREDSSFAAAGNKTRHGQAVDRYGNRLDKDLSKGGGPFSNATTTLVDMWNRGFSSPWNLADSAARDPLRPVLKAPGRMYMVLAAQRLAALVSMIRGYHDDETVSVVAHSQGCMVSLLAQAFLMQRGERPADTLVLTHPPYSLVDDVPALNDTVALFSGGEDPAMAQRYADIAGMQTLNARLRTLANIVQGVASGKHGTPALAALQDPKHHGVVGCKWEPGKDRDNRGKVYLYFCPEDMTVALDQVQGIGWQGVPDFAYGSKLVSSEKKSALGGKQRQHEPSKQTREALKELGKGFFQRVFTARQRTPGRGKPPQAVLVGGAAPSDFALRVDGEDDHAHVADGAATLRARSPEVTWPVQDQWLGVIDKPETVKRDGIRTITGEPLNTPVQADMYAGSITQAGQPQGAHESVDPIDAAISVTSDYGLMTLPTQIIADPRPPAQRLEQRPNDPLFPHELEQLATAMNAGKQRGDSFTIAKAHYIDGKQVRLNRRETPNEARLRQQQRGVSARSFHGAIFGSAKNHRHVTAYDVAIGGGQAVSDPKFYAYLCAVADWRLKTPDPREPERPGIMTWQTFEGQFGEFLAVELPWCKDLITGNRDYYSSGKLPASLPVLPEGLPPNVLSETMGGKRIDTTPVVVPVKKVDADRQTNGEWLHQGPATGDPTHRGEA